MRVTSPIVRHVSTRLVLVCIIVAITGCDQTPPPSTEKAATVAQSNTAATMVSSVSVKGDEALPPNHPPLPSFTPPHPTNAAGTPPDLNQQLASLHPKQTGKKQLGVAVPANVKGKWASATLAVTIDGAEKELKLAIGETTPLGENLQLHLVHFLPAYTSDAQTVTSSSNKPVNPAIQIQTLSNGQVVAEGWIFQKLPEFNSFNSNQIKVRLVSAERTRSK